MARPVKQLIKELEELVEFFYEVKHPVVTKDDKIIVKEALELIKKRRFYK